jgi:hypothetical protein
MCMDHYRTKFMGTGSRCWNTHAVRCLRIDERFEVFTAVKIRVGSSGL